MMNIPVDNNINSLDYLYRITCHEQEKSLCSMEMRALWGESFISPYSTVLLRSSIRQQVSRSPFMKYRISIWCEADNFQELLIKAASLPHITQSYKVVALDEQINGRVEDFAYHQRRELEQALGKQVKGKVNLKQPELLLGITKLEDCWIFGQLEYPDPIWQRHNEKPRQYSTALSTKVARAIVNIAVPTLDHDMTLFDPCCGIGTVLMEACSQGIHASGSDINPLAVIGARENMAAFHYECELRIHNMLEIQEQYDVAILDLPYNHCSVLPADERIQMLSALKSIAPIMIVVSVEPIEQELLQLGYKIEDRCSLEKMNFKRDIFLCSISS